MQVALGASHLTLDYLDFGAGSGPACTHAMLQIATAGMSWRTKEGLSVGATTETLKRIYPGARRQGRRGWLLTPHFSAATGGLFPPIVALVSREHVKQLEAWVGGAGE